MAASHDPLDDRQHGHAIRRRQGGRTSIYHDQLYPRGAIEKNLPHEETFETFDSGDLARAVDAGTPGARAEQMRRRQHDADWEAAVAAVPGGWPPIRGSDSATGAY